MLVVVSRELCRCGLSRFAELGSLWRSQRGRTQPRLPLARKDSRRADATDKGNVVACPPQWFDGTDLFFRLAREHLALRVCDDDARRNHRKGQCALRVSIRMCEDVDDE